MTKIDVALLSHCITLHWHIALNTLCFLTEKVCDNTNNEQPLTPMTDKIAFASAFQVIPLPVVFEYGSSTILTYKVIRLTWFPVAE